MFVVIPDCLRLCVLYLYWFHDGPYSKRPFGSQNHSQQGHSYLSRHTCTRNCRRSTLQKPLHMPKSTPLQWKYMMMYLACGDLGSASTLGRQQDEIPTPSVLVAPINGKSKRSTAVLEWKLLIIAAVKIISISKRGLHCSLQMIHWSMAHTHSMYKCIAFLHISHLIQVVTSEMHAEMWMSNCISTAGIAWFSEVPLLISWPSDQEGSAVVMEHDKSKHP